MNENNVVSNIEEKDRQATVLELFLDLAFVFSIAQITTFISENETLTGTLKGVMLTWFVWWLWTAFTWAGAAVDFQSSTKHRVFVLSMIPAIVLMAIALPNAFSDQAFWFACFYLVVQVWITTLQGLDAWTTTETRKAWLSYGPPALIAPIVLLAGSFFDGNTQIVIWMVVILINVLAAFLGGKKSNENQPARIWKINAAHYTERHSLFMIIVLGEVVVAIGIKATSLTEKYGLNFDIALGAALAISIACMYWWSYFAYIPKVIEHTLKQTPAHLKGQFARDIFSFGHFPLVLSIIFFAVVGKHFIEHTFEILSDEDLILLAVSGCGFLASIMFSQYRVSKHISKERVFGFFVILGICYIGIFVPGWATVSLFSATLLIISIFLWKSFKRTEIYKEIMH